MVGYNAGSVFDFACYYKMNDAFDGNNLNLLNDDMMWKRNPYKSYFVTNHDTDEIYNKQLAYAYILTHEGYPTIFYQDYEEWLNKSKWTTFGYTIIKRQEQHQFYMQTTTSI
jgi:alpha-amylase